MSYTIYSRNGCPYCDNVRKVLTGIGETFVEYKLDTDFNREQFVSQFGHGATFPRVVKDGQLLGGCNETVLYLRNQGLV